MEWISVKDRLPDKGTPVLVYIADRGSVMITHFYEDFALIRIGPETGPSAHGVTHWYPLEPPNLDK